VTLIAEDPPPEFDVAANRAARKYSRRELALRVAWGVAAPAFAFSPRLLWGWRRALLRLFGAKVGRDVRVFPTVRIMMPWNLDLGDQATIGDRVSLYALGPIRIGARATVSQNAHLCAGTHDFRRADFALVKAPVTVGADAWICADAFVGPGVTVGDHAVVGARAVVVRTVESRAVVAGNPARVVGRR
jgi:putative colanic acid biosynthesis acetyltransferase WcaF